MSQIKYFFETFYEAFFIEFIADYNFEAAVLLCKMYTLQVSTNRNLERKLTRQNRIKVFQTSRSKSYAKRGQKHPAESARRSAESRLTHRPRAVSQPGFALNEVDVYHVADETEDATSDDGSEVKVGHVLEHLDNEIGESRCISRNTFISHVSQTCMADLNRMYSAKLSQHRVQSAAVAKRSIDSRKSSLSSSHGRPGSALNIVRSRAAAESVSHLAPLTPGARPPSAASFMSNNDDAFSDGEATSTSRYGLTSSGTNRNSLFTLSAEGSRRMKLGALEGAKPCKRMESVLNEDLSAVVNDLSRQCCDVLGPTMCCECIKNVNRFNNFITFHNKHPDIDETAMTLYAIPLVQRMFPDLHKSEIKAKLVSGEISQQLKLKVNRSKDIELFDEKMTDYLPEKYRRSRMRKQRMESGKGVVKVDGSNDLYVQPFNPSKCLRVFLEDHHLELEFFLRRLFG